MLTEVDWQQAAGFGSIMRFHSATGSSYALHKRQFPSSPSSGYETQTPTYKTQY
jgi:hypothetical protein